MGQFLAILFLLLPLNGFSATTQVLNLVSGPDFLPLVDDKAPEGGVTTQTLRKALATQGYDLHVTFRPWARGMDETKKAEFDATYPYVKTSSREKDFLFSDPLYVSRVRVFVLKGRYRSMTDLKGKSICIPLGYDNLPLKNLAETNSLTSTQTPSLTSCLDMIHYRRIDCVAIPEPVAWETIQRHFQKKEDFAALDGRLDDISYHAMVSKTHPRAKEILALLNKGLQSVK